MPACAAILGELDPRRVAAPEPQDSGPATAPSWGSSSPLWLGDHMGDSWCARWINGQLVVADELDLL